MNATAFLWLVGLPLLASPVVYVLGRLGANQDPEARCPALARWLTVLTLLATWIPFALAAQAVAEKGKVTFNIEAIGLTLDGVSLVLAATVLAVGTGVALHSVTYMAGEVGEEKYYAMLLAMIGVMIGLGCANGLFNLWVWFEAMSVSSYLLVAFYREQPASLEAGMKYLVQSALGSALVLSHVGYMLLGLGISFQVGQSAGAQGAFFHLFNHGLMKGLAFLAAGALLYALHLAVGSQAPLMIQELNGAAKRYPMPALALSVAVLALGGLPPLAGFMSKWQIFVAGFTTHNALIASLVIFAALNSVLSLAYYAPLVNAVYRKEPSAAVTRGAVVPDSMVLPLTVLTALIVVLGLWPSLLNWLTEPAGAALVAALRG